MTTKTIDAEFEIIKPILRSFQRSLSESVDEKVDQPSANSFGIPDENLKDYYTPFERAVIALASVFEDTKEYAVNRINMNVRKKLPQRAYEKLREAKEYLDGKEKEVDEALKKCVGKIKTMEREELEKASDLKTIQTCLTYIKQLEERVEQAQQDGDYKTRDELSLKYITYSHDMIVLPIAEKKTKQECDLLKMRIETHYKHIRDNLIPAKDAINATLRKTEEEMLRLEFYFKPGYLVKEVA